MTYNFGKEYFTDQQIIDYVNSPEMHPTIFSFVDPENEFHHLLPVWTIFYEGKFYLSTDNYSKKYKIIESKPTKVGLSIMERESYPNGRPDVIPYFYVSGKATIRKKEEFSNYEDVLIKLYDKFNAGFPNEEAKQNWIKTVLEKSKSRVLIEIEPEKVGVYEKIEAYRKKLQNKEIDTPKENEVVKF